MRVDRTAIIGGGGPKVRYTGRGGGVHFGQGIVSE